MKKILALISVIVLFTMGCNNQKSNPIEGAWDMVYYINVENDSVLWNYQVNMKGKNTKMWNEDHFIFVSHYTVYDTLDVEAAGGGSYTLEGNIYKESPDFSYDKDAIGTTIQMSVRVSNDTLYQIWPVNENGEFDKASYSEQRYIRLE